MQQTAGETLARPDSDHGTVDFALTRRRTPSAADVTDSSLDGVSTGAPPPPPVELPAARSLDLLPVRRREAVGLCQIASRLRTKA
jgi:hypothetical protein